MFKKETTGFCVPGYGKCSPTPSLGCLSPKLTMTYCQVCPAQTYSDEHCEHTDKNPQAHCVPNEAPCHFLAISCHTEQEFSSAKMRWKKKKKNQNLKEKDPEIMV